SAPDAQTVGRGDLVRMTGTSMASPHVAGTMALMFEAAGRPLRIEETRELLFATARPPAFGALTPRHGHGRLDIDGAVRAAREIGRRSVAQMRESNGTRRGRSIDVAALGARSPYADGSVALADRLIGLGGAYAASPEALLGRVLASTMREGVADHVISHSLLHPTIVFDTFTTARMAGVRPHLSRVFEAVLYPRQAFGSPRPGDLLVR